jgi:hypothetical protein
MVGVFCRRGNDRRVTGSAAGGNRAGRRRARGFARGILAAAASLAVAGATPSTVLAAAVNLLPNGEFTAPDGSASLSDFKTQDARLSLARDSRGGGYAAKVTQRTTSTSYGFYASPRPVTFAVQGTRYSARIQVRSDTPGRKVCLQLRERARTGAAIGSAQKCRRTTWNWRALPTVTYAAQQTGSSIGFVVRQFGANTRARRLLPARGRLLRVRAWQGLQIPTVLRTRRPRESFEAEDLMLSEASSSSPEIGSPPATPSIVRWHMNETAGATMYDSAGSDDGTRHAVIVGQPGFTGTSYGFGGATSRSYVSVPSVDALNPDTSDFGFTIHVQTTSTPTSGDYDIMRKGGYSTTTGSQEYKMEIQPSGEASCAFRGSTGHGEIIAGPTVADGQWHTLGCSKTSTAITLTVDGQSFSHSVQIGSISNTSPLVMGAHPGSDYYKGLLSEASVIKG